MKAKWNRGWTELSGAAAGAAQKHYGCETRTYERSC